MKAPTAMTIRDNVNDTARIGLNKRSPKTQTALKIEERVLAIAPLPTTFDIAPCQSTYFYEMAYHDLMGGLFLHTLNEEVDARIMEQAINDTSADYKQADAIVNNIHDKYILDSAISEPKLKKVVLMPGSNLLHAISYEKLDQILHNNPDAMIKPHPVMTTEGLKIIARRYGFHRIIDPKESGISYLMNADEVYTTASSETGLYAAALKKKMYDITKLQYQQKLSYATIFRLFKDGDIDHNYDIICRAFNSNKSGVLMPWHDNIDERIQNLCNEAMKLREFFKPRWAWQGDAVLSLAPPKPKKD